MKKEIKPGKDFIGIGGGILIFNSKKEVLLLKRGKNSKNEAGWWCKPGGAIEYGETAIKAMKREIKEEVNLEVDVWGLVPHTDHILKKEGQHWIAINFLANVKRGNVKNNEPHKIDEVQWFALNNLPKKLSKTTSETIKNYLQKKFIRL